MTRKRKLWIAAASLAGLLLLTAVAGVFILRSQWFYEKVRRKIVATVETATGGRVEIQSFTLDWKRLRAEVRSFTLHGTEPPDKPPLFTAASVAVGIKIVSVFKKDFDIQYLDVTDPRVYLIVYPGGRTNVPEPKIEREKRNAVETILELAIGRFNLVNGTFEVESQYRTAFSARGQKLTARFDYEAATPLYRGNISIQPLDLRLPDRPALPVGVDMAVTVERNRIGVTSAKLTTGGSAVDLSGTVDDLTNPRLDFRYDARVQVADAARFLRVQALKSGTVQVAGNAKWAEGSGLSASGRLQGENFEYRDASVRLRDLRADGAFTADAGGVDLSGMRLAGNYVTNDGPVPVQGRIASLKLRDNDLDLRGIALGALGGTFQGDARLRNLDIFSVNGEIKNFEARRTIALYAKQKLPWDAKVSGTVRLETSLRRRQDLRATVNLALAPAPESAPVHGQIAANYDARNGTLELGRSTVTLPNSRADFSGTLGRELRVHAETRDLNDILPVLGVDTATVPVRLETGAAIFDGTVTGTLDRPIVGGHIDVTGFSYSGTAIDSLSGDLAASPDNVRLRNATIRRGTLSARFQAAVGLQEWKTSDSSQVFGDASIDNAALPDVLALAGKKDLPATGTLTATATLTGTIGKPLAAGDLDVVKGSYGGEPFDRITARVSYGEGRAEIAEALIVAGPRQVRLAATFEHAPNRFDTGRLHFQVDSNAMSLEQIQTLQKARPGVKGTVRIAASGDLALAPAAAGSESVRLVNLQADLKGENLALTGQALGNAHLVATSQGQILRTNLDATVANSQVRGTGEWRLEGDYPGNATVTFTRLDLAQVRQWVSPSTAGASGQFTGFTEGAFRIEGPALKPEMLKAELRLPSLVIGSKPRAGLPVAYTLENVGPIVAKLASDVITIENARLKGRESDIELTGKIALTQKNALDLRLDGHIGLGILSDFNADVVASGTVEADATVRGEFASPQITGRLQLRNAALSVADLPNGISKASGLIVFNANRATIQSLTGETGGGAISLSGFVAYSEGDAVFNIAARANQVRVRYPEGVSTTANANLTLTGTTGRSLLGGTVTILRTGFNPRSDFSQILAGSSEPVRTPAARTGFLGGMAFDVQINTDPDIQFQSTLTQDLQVDGRVKLLGTASNPGLLGRLNITQGQVLFYGTKYTINQGSISLYNPSKVEPILDIDLETKARGIDITFTISGPLSKLTLTPRSDPPMEYSEIIALVATGKTPSSDSALITQQNSAQQSWQQMGANALLGQVVANPVSGRLQRLFGVSKLRIDPTLPGVENNLQARLTLEQQVTPDVTFTYITNVTSTNPQIVRVEWAWSKQWSVVALREENGVFGLDFIFKRRF